MDFKKAVSEILKKRYVRFIGEFEYDDKMSSSQAIYYFKNLDDNLIEPMTEATKEMYSKGNGNELNSKMKALKSSSAMTYNLMGNDIIEVKSNAEFEPGKYSITFEHKLPTLKNRSSKANLDAFLEGEKELIFCEMKMTEWLSNHHGMLRNAYLDKENYFYKDSFKAFIRCIEAISESKQVENEDTKCVFKHYDAFQILKHIIAIYNFTRANSKTIPQKITLVNCVWHLPDSQSLHDSYIQKYEQIVKADKEEFNMFYEATDEIRKQFKMIDKEFDIKYKDAKKFVQNFKKTKMQLDYLKRYCDLSTM